MREPKTPRKTRGADARTALDESSKTDDVQVGQTVYRVVEDDPPEGPPTWRVMERKIIQVTSLKLRLDRPFPGSERHGLVLKSVCIGRLFHLSAIAALDHFREAALRNLAYHDRMTNAAKRELDWWQAESEKRESEASKAKSDGALFIIIGARDDSDGERSTTDYAVCYLEAEIPARRLAERMNELAHKLERFMPPTEEGVQAMRTLDLKWARGAEKPTHYRVERVPRGVVTP